jgi:hypothetical protein
MTISEIQSTYPSAVWFDKNYTGTTESGTFAEPYNTFSEAHTAVSDGGVIAVKAGTHQDNLVAMTTKDLTIVGTGHDAILERNATGSTLTISANVTFIDLTLKSTYSGTSGCFFAVGGTSGSTLVTLRGCKCVNTSSTFEGFISGLNNASGDLSVFNSIFEVQGNHADRGVLLRTWFYGSLGDVTFDGCTIKLTGGSSANFLGFQKLLTSTYTIKNTIFVGYTGSETLMASTSGQAGTLVDNYNCYSNTGHSGGTNNIFQDPQFVDSANGDYRLRPTSPCIGAGTAS